MDEDEINRLMQNALDQANARAEQKFEERLTALREEFNQKHQEEMTELQEQLAQSRGGFTTQEKYAVEEICCSRSLSLITWILSLSYIL